jgi:hypothetical protein
MAPFQNKVLVSPKPLQIRQDDPPSPDANRRIVAGIGVVGVRRDDALGSVH